MTRGDPDAAVPLVRRDGNVGWLVVGVALLLVVGTAAETAARVGSDDPVAELSFEPFLVSRMWPVFFGPRAPFQIDAAAVEGMERFVEEALGEPVEALDPSPRDSAEVDPGLRDPGRWMFVPFLALQLIPLGAADPWGPLEVRQATAIARYFRALDPELSVRFVEGSLQRNRPALDRLALWYRQRSHDPARMAYMIATMDDGPWRIGETDDDCGEGDVKEIADGFSIRLCGASTLVGRRDGRSLWRGRLARAGGALRFTKREPIALGDYGWRVDLSFGEGVHLYLNPDFEPLFYFTSW